MGFLLAHVLWFNTALLYCPEVSASTIEKGQDKLLDTVINSTQYLSMMAARGRVKPKDIKQILGNVQKLKNQYLLNGEGEKAKALEKKILTPLARLDKLNEKLSGCPKSLKGLPERISNALLASPCAQYSEEVMFEKLEEMSLLLGKIENSFESQDISNSNDLSKLKDLLYQKQRKSIISSYAAIKTQFVSPMGDPASIIKEVSGKNRGSLDKDLLKQLEGIPKHKRSKLGIAGENFLETHKSTNEQLINLAKKSSRNSKIQSIASSFNSSFDDLTTPSNTLGKLTSEERRLLQKNSVNGFLQRDPANVLLQGPMSEEDRLVSSFRNPILMKHRLAGRMSCTSGRTCSRAEENLKSHFEGITKSKAKQKVEIIAERTKMFYNLVEKHNRENPDSKMVLAKKGSGKEVQRITPNDYKNSAFFLRKGSSSELIANNLGDIFNLDQLPKDRFSFMNKMMNGGKVFENSYGKNREAILEQSKVAAGQLDKAMERKFLDYVRSRKSSDIVTVADMESMFASSLKENVRTPAGISLSKLGLEESFKSHKKLQVARDPLLGNRFIMGLGTSSNRLFSSGDKKGIDKKKMWQGLENFLTQSKEYMNKVDEWYDDKSPEEFITDTLYYNPEIAAQVMTEHPELAGLICKLTKNAIEKKKLENASDEEMDRWMMIGSIIAGVALVIATGGFALAGAAVLGVLVTSGVGLVAGGISAGYHYSRHRELQDEYETTLSSYVTGLSSNDPEEAEKIKKLLDGSEEKFKQALWDGGFAALDGVFFLKGLRALNSVSKLKAAASGSKQVMQEAVAKGKEISAIEGIADAGNDVEDIIRLARVAKKNGASAKDIVKAIDEGARLPKKELMKILSESLEGKDIIKASKAAGFTSEQTLEALMLSKTSFDKKMKIAKKLIKSSKGKLKMPKTSDVELLTRIQLAAKGQSAFGDISKIPLHIASKLSNEERTAIVAEQMRRNGNTVKDLDKLSKGVVAAHEMSVINISGKVRTAKEANIDVATREWAIRNGILGDVDNFRDLSKDLKNKREILKSEIVLSAKSGATKAQIQAKFGAQSKALGQYEQRINSAAKKWGIDPSSGKKISKAAEVTSEFIFYDKHYSKITALGDELSSFHRMAQVDPPPVEFLKIMKKYMSEVESHLKLNGVNYSKNAKGEIIIAKGSRASVIGKLADDLPNGAQLVISPQDLLRNKARGVFQPGPPQRIVLSNSSITNLVIDGTTNHELGHLLLTNASNAGDLSHPFAAGSMKAVGSKRISSHGFGSYGKFQSLQEVETFNRGITKDISIINKLDKLIETTTDTKQLKRYKAQRAGIVDELRGQIQIAEDVANQTHSWFKNLDELVSSGEVAVTAINKPGGTFAKVEHLGVVLEIPVGPKGLSSAEFNTALIEKIKNIDAATVDRLDYFESLAHAKTKSNFLQEINKVGTPRDYTKAVNPKDEISRIFKRTEVALSERERLVEARDVEKLSDLISDVASKSPGDPSISDNMLKLKELQLHRALIDGDIAKAKTSLNNIKTQMNSGVINPELSKRLSSMEKLVTSGEKSQILTLQKSAKGELGAVDNAIEAYQSKLDTFVNSDGKNPDVLRQLIKERSSISSIDELTKTKHFLKQSRELARQGEGVGGEIFRNATELEVSASKIELATKINNMKLGEGLVDVQVKGTQGLAKSAILVPNNEAGEVVYYMYTSSGAKIGDVKMTAKQVEQAIESYHHNDMSGRLIIDKSTLSGKDVSKLK
ncbi:hypothetical protein A9Q84_19495 [Halobacteriovorax marinus]|uniref:Uncharacterized protein n=1 Tax=Halobacteriovorax marinus TaxID=97084 RepID=A0A1Y5F2M3_9BACT|nr:hypothetical protein A9Q84_19495 [Halobacteriovorax marinus]